MGTAPQGAVFLYEDASINSNICPHEHMALRHGGILGWEAVMLENGNEYLQVLNQVKREITQTRARIAVGANAEVIKLYWRIGKVLIDRSIYGTRYINTLAHDLRVAFPGLKGFSARSLRYMAKFAREVDSEFCNSCCKIPWGHITHLLDKTKSSFEREWYVQAAIENGWSRTVLVHQIESRLYERQALSGTVSNFSRTLPEPKSELAQTGPQGSVYL